MIATSFAVVMLVTTPDLPIEPLLNDGSGSAHTVLASSDAHYTIGGASSTGAGAFSVFSLCNGSPVQVQAFVAAKSFSTSNSGVSAPRRDYSAYRPLIEAGHCVEFEFWNSGDDHAVEVFLGGSTTDPLLNDILKLEPQEGASYNFGSFEFIKANRAGWSAIEACSPKTLAYNREPDYTDYSDADRKACEARERLVPSETWAEQIDHFVIKDHPRTRFTFLIPEASIPIDIVSDEGHAAHLLHAQNLRRSLLRPDFQGAPFHVLGVNAPRDDPTLPGLKVASVSNPGSAHDAGIRAGDIILSINNNVIYSVNDVLQIIRQHAHRHGIEKPLTVEYEKSGEVHAYEVPYMYSSHACERDSENGSGWLGALFYGFLDGAILGAETSATCIGKKIAIGQNQKECQWETTQIVALKRQCFPGTYRTGSLGGSLLPSTRLLGVGKVGLLGKAARRGRVPNALVNAWVESLDSSITEIIRAAPGTSPDEILKRIQKELPVAAGLGFAVGTLWSPR